MKYVKKAFPKSKLQCERWKKKLFQKNWKHRDRNIFVLIRSNGSCSDHFVPQQSPWTTGLCICVCGIRLKVKVMCACIARVTFAEVVARGTVENKNETCLLKWGSIEEKEYMALNTYTHTEPTHSCWFTNIWKCFFQRPQSIACDEYKTFRNVSRCTANSFVVVFASFSFRRLVFSLQTLVRIALLCVRLNYVLRLVQKCL